MIGCQRAKFLADRQKYAEAIKSGETGLRTGSRIDDQDRAGANTSTPAGATANSRTRRGDRHSPGYQRDLMRARRAIAAGLAERFPRTA
ncbi:MAG: hypothetical protein U1A72_11710 [Sulfuritalea sp.]|nr:hypothetical protein [Sulfuritalea sp.]